LGFQAVVEDDLAKMKASIQRGYLICERTLAARHEKPMGPKAIIQQPHNSSNEYHMEDVHVGKACMGSVLVRNDGAKSQVPCWDQGQLE